MPAILATVLNVLGSTLLSMLSSLVTKKFLKKLIIAGLEKIVAATETDADNKILEDAKAAWAKEEEKENAEK